MSCALSTAQATPQLRACAGVALHRFVVSTVSNVTKRFAALCASKREKSLIVIRIVHKVHPKAVHLHAQLTGHSRTRRGGRRAPGARRPRWGLGAARALTPEPGPRAAPAHGPRGPRPPAHRARSIYRCAYIVPLPGCLRVHRRCRRTRNTTRYLTVSVGLDT